MLRCGSSQKGNALDFDAGTEPLAPAGLQTTAQSTVQQQDQQQSLANAIALVRKQSRRRSSDPAANDGSVPPRSGQLAPLRTRVQQQQPVPIAQLQQQGHTLPDLQQRAISDGVTASSKCFSVFENPLSAPRQASRNQLAAAASEARRPASLLQLAHADRAQQDAAAAAAAAQTKPEDSSSNAPTSTATEPNLSDSLLKAATAADISSPVKHSELFTKSNKTLRFEVQQATEYNQHDGIGCSNQDQQQWLGAADQEHSSAPTQQYVYDEDTGQLCRVGEGADTTRLARHYLEDWNTGEFFMMAEPNSGCMSWLRRRPQLGPAGWGLGALQEPNLLRSLSEFTDNMGSVMATLGLFAQGMAGGLALLSFFMTYLQYATAGRDGLLAYYSAPAQMVNRAFFTLISLSLVSASSRLAYDQLGNFKPSFLRLRLADGVVLTLYLVAYVCNLIAAPIDDQLTFEARRDVNYWALPQQRAFVNKVNLWQVLNLLRIICCGLAWVIVSYRGNHMVMMMVFEARHQQQQPQEEQAGSVGGSTAAAAGRAVSSLPVGPAAVAAAAGDAWHQTSIAGFMTGDQVACADYRVSNCDAGASLLRGMRVLESSTSVAGRGGHVQRQASRSGIGSGRLVDGVAAVSGGAGTAARGGLPPLSSSL